MGDQQGRERRRPRHPPPRAKSNPRSRQHDEARARVRHPLAVHHRRIGRQRRGRHGGEQRAHPRHQVRPGRHAERLRLRHPLDDHRHHERFPERRRRLPPRHVAGNPAPAHAQKFLRPHRFQAPRKTFALRRGLLRRVADGPAEQPDDARAHDPARQRLPRAGRARPRRAHDVARRHGVHDEPPHARARPHRVARQRQEPPRPRRPRREIRWVELGSLLPERHERHRHSDHEQSHHRAHGRRGRCGARRRPDRPARARGESRRRCLQSLRRRRSLGRGARLRDGHDAVRRNLLAKCRRHENFRRSVFTSGRPARRRGRRAMAQPEVVHDHRRPLHRQRLPACQQPAVRRRLHDLGGVRRNTDSRREGPRVREENHRQPRRAPHALLDQRRRQRVEGRHRVAAQRRSAAARLALSRHPRPQPQRTLLHRPPDQRQYQR